MKCKFNYLVNGENLDCLSNESDGIYMGLPDVAIYVLDTHIHLLRKES